MVLFNEDPLILVTIEVVDAKTQEQIVADLADSVQINIEGNDKDAIIDLTEKPSTFFTSHYGFFTFAIIDDHQISPTNPVRITIVASSEGYITNSIPITITSTQGETYTIALVQRSNPPEGSVSTTKTEGLTDSEGAVKEDIVFTSDPESNTKTEVTLKVTQGTIIKDEEGEVLTGNLTTNITLFNNQSSESLNSFPGGLFANVTDRTGESKDVIFIPAAFVSVEITDESGKNAKTFDKPVEVSLQIPGDTHNPETDTTIRNGDILPIWNYDEEKATWVYYTEGTVSGPDENGNFEVPFAVAHFSYWTAGWEDKAGEMCEEGLTIHITGEFTTVEVRILKQSDGTYFSSLGKRVNSTDPHVHLQKSPRNIPVTIEAWYGSDIVGSVNVDNLCGEYVNLEVDIPGKEVSFSVEVYDNNDPEKRMRPNRGIYIDENGSRKYVGYMKDGEITVYGLTEGIEYTFWVFHEDTWYSGTHLVDERSFAEIEFPVEP